jgi:hypothetical protein
MQLSMHAAKEVLSMALHPALVKSCPSSVAPRLCLLVIACLVAVLTTAACDLQMFTEWTGTIDAFMQAMVKKDAEQAYSHFSTAGQRQYSLADIRKMMEGSNYALFDGYSGADMLSFDYTSEPSSGGSSEYVDLEYETNYAGGHTGTLRAGMLREQGAWRLSYVDITVPPPKVEEFLRKPPR